MNFSLLKEQIYENGLFKKNSETSAIPMSHKGKEVAVVLKGCVKLILDDYFEILEIGDSVQIPALTPHKMQKTPSGEKEFFYITRGSVKK